MGGGCRCEGAPKGAGDPTWVGPDVRGSSTPGLPSSGEEGSSVASPRPPQLWAPLSEPPGPRGCGLTRQHSAQHSATPNSETHHWTSKACARTVQRLTRPSSELRWDRARQPWATPGPPPRHAPSSARGPPPTGLHERGRVGRQPVGPRAGEALQLGLWRDFIAVKGVIFLLRVQLSQPAGNTRDSHRPGWPQARGLCLCGPSRPGLAHACLHPSH